MKNIIETLRHPVLISLILMITIIACKKDDDKIVEGPKVIDIGVVSDIDGNEYKTVILGNQEWMAENLRTTHYSNGIEIELPGIDTMLWQTNTTGALAWYDNDEVYQELYGGLYNWYAINSSNGLCPDGWRIPSTQDWNKLIQYLREAYNLSNAAEDEHALGNRLKSCRQRNSPMGVGCSTDAHPRWNDHNIHYGTNDFEFSALPGGDRLTDGRFTSLGSYGFWWTSREVNSDQAYYRYINYDRSIIFQNITEKNYGLSVRCIKE